MEKIFYNQELIGILVTDFSPGLMPITDETEPLQVLALAYKKGGHVVAPHKHSPRQRTVAKLQECLIVRQGRIKIDLYGSDNIYFRTLELKQGEIFISLAGGHGVEFLEDSEVFEIKNGPFQEDKVPILKFSK